METSMVEFFGVKVSRVHVEKEKNLLLEILKELSL